MDNGNIRFDKFFRDKLNDVEFSRQKDTWELLNYLLKQRARAKQRVRFLKFFFSLLILATGTWFFINPFKANKESNTNTIEQSKRQNLQMQLPVETNASANNSKEKNSVVQESIEKNTSQSSEEKTEINKTVQLRPDVVPSNENDIVSLNEGESLADKVVKPDEESNELQVTGDNPSAYDFYSAMNTMAWGSDSFKIEITNAGKAVNSSYSDFAPVISADGSTMFFTSRRPVTGKEMKQRGQAMERVYSCSMNAKNNKWVNTFMLSAAINMEGRNNSAIGISNDGQHLLLYRDDISGNGDIYESILSGAEWSRPELIAEPVSTKYHESSASMSPDGKTLYFISDRPGGIGGRDIWYCTLDANGKWKNAVNLGLPVNTPQDEEGIFIHPDGKTMYFSSKGHKGLGGYDVYRTIRQTPDGNWSEPVNLGAPLNTAGDDVYFVLEANGTTGYYASARPGGNGEKDIYKVTFLWLEEKHVTPNLVLVKGTISDDKGKPFSASIEIMDNEKNEVVTKLSSNSVTGKYLVSLPSGKNYGIHVSAKGYLFHSENFNIADASSYAEVNKDIVLKKIEVGETIILKNIFYDFDKATLRNESVSELQRLVSLMEQYPTLKIELSSHTDSKGADDYNLTLSQSRAQSVVDYLISKNISKDRLVAKGYGETVPVALNQNPDGTDNPEGRQMNRRTEFKILAY